MLLKGKLTHYHLGKYRMIFFSLFPDIFASLFRSPNSDAVRRRVSSVNNISRTVKPNFTKFGMQYL